MRKNEKKIYFQGMTCNSCETFITSKLKENVQVQEVKMVLSSGEATIFFNDEQIDLDSQLNDIEKHGYQYRFEPFDIKHKSFIKQWLLPGIIVIGLFIFWELIKSSGLLDIFDLNYGKMTLGLAFLTGLVASLSTCLAIVGSVVITFSTKYQNKSGRVWQPNINFQLGRLVSFMIFGGVLGWIGGALKLNENIFAGLTILVGVILFFMALNMLEVPLFKRLRFSLFPAKFNSYWEKFKNSEKKSAPFIIGIMTFFLPCGFTQSMQLLALGSGSFISGSVLMGLFVLGTAPILFSIGVLSGKLSSLKSLILNRVLGLLIICFAVYSFISGLTVLGIDFPVISAKNIESEIKYDVQVVKTELGYGRFMPNVILLKKNIPVRWEIIGTVLSGCTNEIIVPTYGIRKKINPGLNIVEFTPTKQGTVGFSCWMGMVRGSFIIE